MSSVLWPHVPFLPFWLQVAFGRKLKQIKANWSGSMEDSADLKCKMQRASHYNMMFLMLWRDTFTPQREVHYATT